MEDVQGFIQQRLKQTAMNTRTFSFIFLLMLTGPCIFCQDIFPPDPIKKQVEASKIVGDLLIDGKLDEPAWNTAPVVRDFIQTDPVQGILARRQTVVKLLYNKDYLYVAAICY